MRRMSAILGCMLLPLIGVAGDWPQFLGPTRNNLCPETGLLASFPARGPKVLWEKTVGEGYSAPVIAGDRLILFHRVGKKDLVECLDAATGKPKWSFEYETEYEDRLGKGNGPRSTPLISGKHVYTLAADGRLHCLDLETGKKVWVRALNDEYGVAQGYFGVATSPLIEGDLIVLNVGGKNAGIVALNKDTGKEVWKSTSDPASYSSPSAVTVGGDRRLIFFTRSGLFILDPADGKVLHSKRWRARIEASVNASAPVVVGDEVFLSASYNTGGIVLKVKKDALEEIWSNDTSLSTHYSTSVHHDGYLYGFHGRQEQGTEFRCVEWKTGKVRWRKEGLSCGALIVVGDRMIVLSEDGELALVDATPEGYKERARAKVLNSFRSHLALSNGRLYARDEKKLVCWDFKK